MKREAVVTAGYQIVREEGDSNASSPSIKNAVTIVVYYGVFEDIDK